MINGHLALLNLAPAVPVVDDATARERRTDLRRTDPGTGSYTRYHNGTNSAKMYIPAGSEVFEYYGDHWFQMRSSSFGVNFPLSANYPAASNLLTTFFTKFDPGNKYGHVQQGNSSKKSKASVLAEDQLRVMYEELLVSFREAPHYSRTIGALPQTWEDVQYVVTPVCTILNDWFELDAPA
jgi:hypothetical protein